MFIIMSFCLTFHGFLSSSYTCRLTLLGLIKHSINSRNTPMPQQDDPESSPDVELSELRTNVGMKSMLKAISQRPTPKLNAQPLLERQFSPVLNPVPPPPPRHQLISNVSPPVDNSPAKRNPFRVKSPPQFIMPIDTDAPPPGRLWLGTV